MFKHLPYSCVTLAAIFAAVGTIFFVLGAHTAYRNWQFSGDVVRVTGTVTGKNITVSHGRHGSTTTYHLDYRFVDNEGKQWLCNDSVISKTYYSLNEQGPVSLKYLPHFPDINRVDLPAEDRSHETTAWICLGVGAVFGGLGWYALIGLERLIFYRRWLRRCGVHCKGKVLGIEANSSLTVNGRAVSYVNYSYTDSVGQRHEDGSQGLSKAQEGLWQEGDSIDVSYDPRDFNKSTVELDR